MNDLWHIIPQITIKFSKKYSSKNIFTAKGESVLNGIRAVKLEPDGIPPIERIMHSSSIIMNKYLIIYGGKSDKAFSKVKNLALNDT